MSTFGFSHQPQAAIGDTVIVDAFLYTRDGGALIPAADITAVTFTFVGPEDTADAPTIDAATGVVLTDDGHAQYVSTATDVAGDYKGIATFSYSEGDLDNLIKSIAVSYIVNDPFVRTGASPADGSIRQAWTFIEDCFDSELGGPWLRDMTLAVFDQSKLRAFIPQVLLQVNQQMPFTNYTENNFPYTANDGEALMALGLRVQTTQHLMRSYTEQPTETGTPVLWQDRTRYQQAWKAIYDIESADWKHWLNRWKLRSYDLSNGKLLIGTKAGRMLPAPMRSRNAGRGF